MTLTWRQIVQEVSAATNLDDALAILVRRVKTSLAVDVCSVYLTGIGCKNCAATDPVLFIDLVELYPQLIIIELLH